MKDESYSLTSVKMDLLWMKSLVHVFEKIQAPKD